MPFSVGAAPAAGRTLRLRDLDGRDLRNALAGAPVWRGAASGRTASGSFLRRPRAAAAGRDGVAARRGRELRSPAGGGPPAGSEVAIFPRARPVDSETRRWLRDGAGRLARFDGIGARDSFRRATASSKGSLPGEALAWDGLARAESSLGEIGRAAEGARRAGALIAKNPDVLPPHEAERLRARALAANRDWKAAIAALEGLFGAQPERVDVGLDLVSTLLACGRTEAADTALGRLRQLAPQSAGSGDPR